MSKKHILIIILFLLINTCFSFVQNHTNTSRIVKIAIMSTNDLHGNAFPKQLIRTDTHQDYKYGGLIYLARLIKIIRRQYGEHSIYLDTGDQFQGSVQSGPQASKGQIISDFFNQLDLKASTIGNHQFDFGKQFLFNFLNHKNSPNLAANLFSQKGQSNFLPKQQSSQIFNLGGIKLGIIGLSTIETPITTSSFVLGKFPKYQFHQYPAITIKESQKLKSQGADIIIVLAHFGNKCPQNKTYDIRTNQTIQQLCQNDQVIKFIDQLPENTIDGILCGHRHKFVHHWYKNIPFLGSIDGGYYFNVLYIYFDTIDKKVVKTQIQGPIPVCQKIFTNTKTCQFLPYQQLLNAGQLTTWMFHNRTVHADQKIQWVFTQKYLNQISRFSQKITQNEMHLAIEKDQQNPISNLVTSLMIKAAQQKNINVMFSIINFGFFRSTWFPGTILLRHFNNMFPFQGNSVTFSILGKYLKLMLQKVQSGSLGFYYLDGIRQYLSISKVLSPDHQDYQIKKGIINATLIDGNPIIDEQYYTGVTIQFLIDGGDDFSKVFSHLVLNHQKKQDCQRLPVYNVTIIGDQRQLLYKQFKKLGKIRSKDWAVTNFTRMFVIQS